MYVYILDPSIEVSSFKGTQQCVSLSSPEDRKRSISETFCFPEFGIKDDGQRKKPNDSERFTPSLELLKEMLKLLRI
jgi:hypothetical protein